jgi:hypothetical protein
MFPFMILLYCGHCICCPLNCIHFIYFLWTVHISKLLAVASIFSLFYLLHLLLTIASNLKCRRVFVEKVLKKSNLVVKSSWIIQIGVCLWNWTVITFWLQYNVILHFYFIVVSFCILDLLDIGFAYLVRFHMCM